MSTVCKTCGAELAENAKFCRNCGAKVDISPTPKTETGEKAASARKKGKLKGVLIAVVIVLAAVIIQAVLSGENPVKDLQDIVFEEYGSKTFGVAVKNSIPEAKWKSEELGEKHYEVIVDGFCPELYSNIQLGFNVNYSGDYVYAKAVYGYIDGEYFDDSYSLGIVLEAIYK